MQAIILAAGMGERLKELTVSNTKCMVKVNNVTIIERLLRQLDSLGLSKIIIVVGYKGEKLITFINSLGFNTLIEFADNPDYMKTNNIYSLYLVRERLIEEDTLLLESDIVLEDSVLKELIDDKRETLAVVDKYASWMDGTCVKIDDDDYIQEFIPRIEFRVDDSMHYYKTVNIYKFSKEFSFKYYIPFLEAYLKALGSNEYYEQVLRVITFLDKSVIQAKRLDGKLWYEVDNVHDLNTAESIFAPTL